MGRYLILGVNKYDYTKEGSRKAGQAMNFMKMARFQNDPDKFGHQVLDARLDMTQFALLAGVVPCIANIEFEPNQFGSSDVTKIEPLSPLLDLEVKDHDRTAPAAVPRGAAATATNRQPASVGA